MSAAQACALLIPGRRLFHDTNLQAQRVENRFHQPGIAGGEIVVGRCQMGSLARQRRNVERQRRRQGFSLTGLHYDNASVVHGDSPQNLDRVMTHCQVTTGGFANEGKTPYQQIPGGLATQYLITQGQRLLAQLPVIQR